MTKIQAMNDAQSIHTDENKMNLINELVACELAMFLAVPSFGGKSPCQENEGTFRMMRKMTHSIHNVPTIQAYLADFKTAQANGRNLVTEKYARMDDLIPPLSMHPLLDTITEAEIRFMEEGARLYPHTMSADHSTYFRSYLRCELETLSDTSLEHYGNTIRQAQETGRNLAVERYDFLWRELGATSLAESEAAMAAQA